MTIPKKNLDAILKETQSYKDTDRVGVPVGFIRDIVKEVRALRRRVSKPKNKVGYGVCEEKEE